MKVPGLLALVALCSSFAQGEPPPAVSTKAIALFDGKTPDGWETRPPILWRVEDGCLTAGDGQTKIPYNDFLCTKRSFSNFVLHFKIKLTGDPATGFINSGVQIRTQRDPAGHEVCGYQCDYGEPDWYGAIYDEGRRKVPLAKADLAALKTAFHQGDWNDYVIKADGPRIQTWLNGVPGVDYEEKNPHIASDGVIGLQIHGGGAATVQFKELWLEELPPTSGAVTWEKLGGVEGQRAKLKPAAATSKPAEGLAANNDRAARAKESPVLKHLVPNPAKPTAVANADAQKVVSTMLLTPGFQAELIAAEPDVRQPIAFAFDERGRMWVAEAFSYPNKQPAGKGKDRISIFVDVDGDGTFKKRTTFIEGLNLVSGLEVGFGGVWVGAAPELLFIPKDAADRAGEPKVLLDGWGFQDTHETLNSFLWGPDGWLYGNQGVFCRSLIGKPGTPENDRVELRSGVWRYHPVRHEFEIFARGGSNQWGLDFNSNGHLFMTHCRSFHGGGGTTQVIRNGIFWNQANANYGPYISNSAPDFAPGLKNFLPAAAHYDSGAGGAGAPGSDAIFGGHSHVGTMIYLGDNWPAAYRDHLFTNNLFGHQMNHQVLERQGSGYEAKSADRDLLLAPDPRYMAVDLQTGPDGAVYLIDWCDLQHCHLPAPEKWDRTNGRIYRISWKETYQPVKVDLGSKSDLELAELHNHPNDWYSRIARRLLQERASERAISAQAMADLRSRISRDVAQSLRAIFTLHAINALTSLELNELAEHESDIVRAWSVQLATDGKSQSDPTLLLQFVHLAEHDPSPTVRLALASALPTLPKLLALGVATNLAVRHPEDDDDRFLPKVLWINFAPLLREDLSLALSFADETKLSSLADSIRWFVARDPKGRNLLLESLTKGTGEAAERGVQMLSFALKDEATLPMPAAWPALHARFSDFPAADQVAALFGDQGVLAKTRATLADASQPIEQRQAAFDLLKRVRDEEALPIFAGLLDVERFRSAAIPLLAGSSDPTVAEALLQRFPKFNAADRSAALTTLTSRPVLALPLLQAVQAGRFDRSFLSALQVRQMRNLRDPQVDTALDQGWGAAKESTAAAKASIAHFQEAYRNAPLWAYSVKRGRETFDQLCAICHAIDKVGGKLGPDLAGSWRNGVDYFIENIVDPNAVIGENFQLHVITKKDGAVVSGLFDQESETAITLRTTAEPVTVAKSEIKEHQKLPQSLMPPGLLEALPEEKALDLLKFLASKPE